MTDKYGRMATPEEVCNAVDNISSARLLKFRASAAQLIPGTAYGEPEDLVHDAIWAALDGRRSWHIRSPFDVFLCGVMKSMASK